MSNKEPENVSASHETSSPIEPQTFPSEKTAQKTDQASPDASKDIPAIERKPIDQINVGAGGKLFVPREEITDEIDNSEELDLADLQAKKIRKPIKTEWFALKQAFELRTRLLVYKPKPDGFEVEHYYVDPKLRGPIREELKMVRIFLCWSFTAKSFFFWIVNLTPGNSYYDDLAVLFKKSEEFFSQNAIRVISVKKEAHYIVKFLPLEGSELVKGPVVWPVRTMEEMLGEALGPDRFITSHLHPLYRDLIAGVELK